MKEVILRQVIALTEKPISKPAVRGIMMNTPTPLQRFKLLKNHYFSEFTETVTEVIDEDSRQITFKTLNFIYKIDYI